MEVKELEIKGLGHSLLSFNCSWLLCSILWNNPPGEQPSSCKRLCIQTSEKTIFMQTNNINNKKNPTHLFSFCPLQEKCKYIQAVRHRFIPDLQNYFNTNESKACMCVG